MKILITGGDGFIGSHLTDRFREEGHTVACLDNWKTGLQREMTYECDIADRARFYEFANRIEPDLVIHCAASYSDPNKWHRDVDTNISGTINAINVAKHYNAKLVYFQTALPPIASYAISKIAGEHYIRLSGVPSLTFRLANVYGPRNVSGPIPAFYKRLSAGDRCTVVHTVRDMVYIDDLIECVMLALKKEKLGTFDVCSGDAMPILALYRAVAAHFPGAPEPDKVPPSGDDVLTAVSVKACLPGWHASTPLVEGVAEAIEWYREHGVGETYSHLKLAG